MTTPERTPNNDFVGRRQELEMLKDAMQRRTNVLVIGVPGIGKTRLCDKLEADLVEKYDFFRPILGTVTTPEQLWAALAKSLPQRWWSTQERDLKYFEDLRETLSNWQANQPNRRAVFLLDDFTILPYFEEVSTFLFEILPKEFDIVIVAAVRLGNFARLYYSSKKIIDTGFPKFLWLLPMTGSDLQQLVEDFIRTKHLHEVEQRGQKIYESIVALSAGNPRLAKLIALATDKQRELSGLFSNEELERAEADLDAGDVREKPLLNDIWDDLDEDTQNALKQLARKRRLILDPKERWWFEKTGLLRIPDLDDFASEIYRSFVCSKLAGRTQTLRAELTRNMAFLSVVSLMVMCFAWTILGVLVNTTDPSWPIESLGISAVLTVVAILVLIRVHWWAGPRRLSNLQKLWLVLTASYVILAIVLVYRLSLWFVPISIGALFAMVVLIRLRIAAVEMDG